MSTLQKIKATIKSHQLIKHGETVIVGVSGGADSTCLLHALVSLSKEYCINIIAAHVNHNLREEAVCDENFVREFCKSLKVPCYVKSADVAKYANEHKLSEEQAGRIIRYGFFDELKSTHNANKIATAHNKNDVAETIVMNFMRGSALSGLSGIPYIREGEIIRPILDITRYEIESYCKDNSINYVTDHTNFEAIYTRNKIRLELIPRIEEFNPNFVDRVVKNARIISDEDDFLTDFSRKRFDEIAVKMDMGYSIELLKLKNEHIAIIKRIILIALEELYNSKQNVPGGYIEDVLNLVEQNQSGKHISLMKDIMVRVEYGKLIIEKKKIFKGYCYKLKVGDSVYIKESNIDIHAQIVEGAGLNDEHTQYFKEEIGDNLSVRTRMDGDFFYPLGMEGKKKIKDYFIDCKIPRQDRIKIPILSNDNDILWIIGKRVDKRYLADEGKRCIKISFKERRVNTDEKE